MVAPASERQAPLPWPAGLRLLVLFLRTAKPRSQERGFCLPKSNPAVEVSVAYRRKLTMRFMVLVKANKDSEAGVLPNEQILAAMAKYNEELVKAGVMLAGDGLQASSKGARVRFEGNKRTVIH